MANLWGRFSMATMAAAKAFRRTWGDPADMMARQKFETQAKLYDYRWHLYRNSIFDDSSFWVDYRSRYGLYRHIRPIYNPVRRLVDFYAGAVYPGVLAVDGSKLPDGTSLAVPLAPDINTGLRDAIGQLWQWTNWQSGKNLYVRYGAALGDVGVEILDEVDRGKVTFDILWPGYVADLEIDSTGNVKAYALEYDTEDSDGQKYTYRKEVDGKRIAEYKNGQLHQFDENVPAERVNPYGFAPMVWCKHTDLGGIYGDPAVRNVSKIDELNEIASHAHDRAHAVLSSPIIASGDGLELLTDDKLTAKQNKTTPAGRESVKLFKAGENGSMSSIELPEGEALNYMSKLIEEIERDHPELTMHTQLREMSQVTGPGAERMIGDVASYVYEARSNYDLQSIKLFQMAVAIAGWRANNGHWGRSLTRQQKAFLPFDLTSYNNGDLDFEIMPRPLVPPVSTTVEEKRVAMEAYDRGVAGWTWASNIVTGDAEAQRKEIDAEAENQPQVEVPRTVNELTQALEQNQQRQAQQAAGQVSNGQQN